MLYLLIEYWEPQILSWLAADWTTDIGFLAGAVMLLLTLQLTYPSLGTCFISASLKW
jgi:hypothetical protein